MLCPSQRRVATCAASAMALSTAATLGLSTPAHRPPGRHTASSSEGALSLSGPVAGWYVAGGRAPARDRGELWRQPPPCASEHDNVAIREKATWWPGWRWGRSAPRMLPRASRAPTPLSLKGGSHSRRS
eukprot:6194884-Pleurochrysis_carterae.AAC.5